MPPKQKQAKKGDRAKPKYRSTSKLESSSKPKAKSTKSSVPIVKDGATKADLKPEVSKKLKWTIRDEMAQKIQAAYRGYRCRNLLLNLKRKKAEFDELMDKLQHEAQQKLCKLQREQEEQQRARIENERKRKQDFTNKIRKMLEAAFDGNVEDIKAILSEVSTLYSGEQLVYQEHKLVECTDSNDNTPLSEAAAGGSPETVRLLLDLGADPNHKGQYGRTPLYRAAFCGHLEAAKVLLEQGADPRIYADDGAIPQQVSANDSLVKLFEQWDIMTTEIMLVKLQDRFAERLHIEEKLQKSEDNKIQALLDDATREYSSKQKQLSKAYEELNKRIYEHDEHGHIQEEITLQAVHEAEDVLAKAKFQTEEAQKRLQKIQLDMRVMRKNFGNGDSEMESEQVDVTINIRELDDVLIKDVGNTIFEGGKWPLLIDPGEQAATYLRYRDTNYLNVCNPRHMEPETIRMAILGAIRYGKCAVLDLLDIADMWSVVQRKFDNVKNNLLSDLMTKNILKDKKYVTLVKTSDGVEYSPMMFTEARMHKFKFVILTQLLKPPKELSEMCYIIKILKF